MTFGAHLRASLRLGLPLIGAQLATIGLGVTDSVMMGWLGAEVLAGGVLGTQLLFIVLIAGSGIAFAVAPLVAAATGAGDARGVRRVVRMALWAVTVYAALTLPLLMAGESVYRALGQEPGTSEIAGTYLMVAAWSLPFALWQNVLRSFLSAENRAAVVLKTSLAGLALNALLDWMFIFGNWGVPALGVAGAALATLGTSAGMFAIFALHAVRDRGLREYDIFRRIWRPDPEALSEVIRLGWPISLTLVAEVSLFNLSAIMMGWIGTLELAAHGIALQICSVIFMLPLGLGQVASIRVGNALGRRNGEDVRGAGWAAAALGIGAGAAGAVLLLLAPGPLIALFLDEGDPDRAAVLAIGTRLLAVAALFQVVDAGQALGAGMLRGLRDTRVPALMAVASYLGLGVPTAYLLAFSFGWGGVGIWTGLAVGLALAAILLLGRFRRSAAAI